MPDFSIGVDLGGTNLRIAAISTEGQLLEKITLGVKVALGRDYVIGEMCDAIHRLTEQYRGSGQFVGAGIGVPGIIDLETGMMRKSANLPGWADYPVRDEIERRVGARIIRDKLPPSRRPPVPMRSSAPKQFTTWRSRETPTPSASFTASDKSWGYCWR